MTEPLLRAFTHFDSISTDPQNYESTKVISPRSKALGVSNFKWVDSFGYPPPKKAASIFY